MSALLNRLADLIFQPLANVCVPAFIAWQEAKDAVRCEFANVTHDEDESA